MHFGIQVRRNLFRRLLLKNFFDNTLPKGRPQGIEGLKFAAQNFRKVVPDIHCEIEDLLVVGDKVTARLSLQERIMVRKLIFCN